jgi:hypothetical protein
MALRQVSPERKAAYYIGTAMQVVGALCFGSVFVSMALFMAGPNTQNSLSVGGPNGLQMPLHGTGIFPGRPHGPSFLPAVIGMGLLIAGGIVKNVGRMGLAGSGIELDPEQARKDVEPWARMGGGVLKDALDEAGLGGVGKSTTTANEALPFDERLRRLEKLRQDGLVNEAEYAAAKKKILDEV